MEQQYSLSRRTFLAGSAVAAATAGLALSGCGSSSSSEGGKPSGSAGKKIGYRNPLRKSVPYLYFLVKKIGSQPVGQPPV